MQRVDHQELLFAPDFLGRLGLHQGVVVRARKVFELASVGKGRAGGGADDTPCIIVGDEELIRIRFVDLDGLAVGALLLIGDKREGVSQEHPHGAVAEAAFLLCFGSGGGGRCGALAKLLGDGPYAGIVSSLEGCRRQQR